MTGVHRPTFFEGQILTAADLASAVAHARDALSRHERCQHTVGIVTGLQLSGEEQTNATGNVFQLVTLSPGLAIDSGGRQVVVEDAVTLNADEFAQVNGADVDEAEWYPVFVQGQDQDVTPSPGFGTGACGAEVMPTRTAETARVLFGRLGDADDLPDPFTGGVADGPPTTSGRLLVGYVRWSIAAGRFAAVTTEARNGIGPTYAGASADAVAARAGRLELRSAMPRVSGTPAVWVDGANGGRMAFGLLNGTGGLDELFAVDASGNVEAKGSVFEGSLPSGAAHVESGIATDGVVLPLPAGITQQQVDDGAVTVHIQVSPLVSGIHHAPGPDFAQASVECEVDADRRVRCRARWFALDGSDVCDVEPAACTYVVIAAVPSS